MKKENKNAIMGFILIFVIILANVILYLPFVSASNITETRAFLTIDFSQPINLLIFIFFIMFIMILVYFTMFTIAGGLCIVLGFILLFSGINTFISLLVILIGAGIIFLFRKK